MYESSLEEIHMVVVRIQTVFQIRIPKQESEGNSQRKDWDIDFADHNVRDLGGTLELDIRRDER